MVRASFFFFFKVCFKGKAQTAQKNYNVLNPNETLMFFLTLLFITAGFCD